MTYSDKILLLKAYSEMKFTTGFSSGQDIVLAIYAHQEYLEYFCHCVRNNFNLDEEIGMDDWVDTYC